ncbi:MAG: hypothetical protein WA208_00055 [Thermoanaerobaculia bacterium]
MITGETIATGAAGTCRDCGVTLELEVLQAARFYVGTMCACGPYSRESGYFETRAEAELALAAALEGEVLR